MRGAPTNDAPACDAARMSQGQDWVLEGCPPRAPCLACGLLCGSMFCSATGLCWPPAVLGKSACPAALHDCNTAGCNLVCLRKAPDHQRCTHLSTLVRH